MFKYLTPIIRPYAYDVIISLRHHLGDIGLHVNAVVSNVPAADHKVMASAPNIAAR